MNATNTSIERKAFFVAVNTGFTRNGSPDQKFIDFYEERSSPRLYCNIVGNVVVPCGYGTNSSTAKLTASRQWQTVASAISSKGSVPGIQLATVWSGFKGSRRFLEREPDEAILELKNVAQNYSLDDIKSLLGTFRSSAEIAITNGFRHIQIHAAHGYLLSLLVDARFNPRAEYTLENLQDLAGWLSAEGAESSIRISMKTGYPPLDREDYNTRLVARTSKLGFDFIDLSSGFYNIDKRLIYPSRPEILSERLSDSLAAAVSLPTSQFIISGRVSRLATEDLPPNVHLGFCRDLIANPNFLADPSKKCANRAKCHYFSRGETRLTCALWKA